MTRKHRKNLTKLVHSIRSARSTPTKLKSLLEKYEVEYGRKTDSEVLEIIAEETREGWAGIAIDRGSNSIDDLLDTLWKSFGDIGGEFTVHQKEGIVKIHATKCPMAETYQDLGKEEYGLIFHCSTDPHIVAGFNESMNFKITKTLMAGDDCCDHCYSMK